MASVMQQNCQIIEWLTEKALGQGWVVFGGEYKMAERFTCFMGNK